MNYLTHSRISRYYEWLRTLLVAVVIASLVRWLVIEAFTIPSSSMEQTLLTGDFIFVSKLHYGARTPKTLLRLPLVHQTIGRTGIPAYLDWIQLPQYRLPGYSYVKRGDKVVFNYPMQLDKPVDLRTYYIKRCVALPNDVIWIDDAQVHIDNVSMPPPPGLQYRYYLKTDTMLSAPFFRRYKIREYFPAREGYFVCTTPNTATRLAKNPAIQAVHRVVMPRGTADPQVYPSSTELPWNADHFGPITVPSKGTTVPINATTLAQYERVITYHEGHREVCIDDNKLWINGQQVTTYTFRQDYYFMMGDNYHNSEDARFWSFVPQDHIVGKAVFVLFSLEPQESFLRKIRWERICCFID